MKSFCQGAGGGRFPELRDRLGLWPLLVKITADLLQARAILLSRSGNFEQAETVADELATMPTRQPDVVGFAA